MKIEKNICKFCMKKCENLSTVEGDTKNVLELLLPKLDFTAKQRSEMCNNCAEMVVKCYDFKIACLNTRDYILPFAKNRNDIKLDLKDVYLIKNTSVVGIPENQSVCGFCMGLIKNSSSVILSVEEGDVMLAKMIEEFLPELDFSIIKQPVICAPCRESLENCFRFVTNCSAVEEKIIKYCEPLDTSKKGEIELNASKVDGNLNDVVKVEQFCENSDEEKIGNGNDIIKLEQMCFVDVNEYVIDDDENFKNNTEINDRTVSNKQYFIPKNMSVCEENNKLISVKKEEMFYGVNDIEHKEGNLVEPKDQKFLFNEAIEIKADEPEFNRSEDGVVVSEPEITAGSHERLKRTFQTEDAHRIEERLRTRTEAPRIKTHRCNSCPYESNSAYGLKMHSLVHKDPSQVTIYRCDSCSYWTKLKHNLRKHSIVHEDASVATTYGCDVCTFRTRRKNYLRYHSRVHMNPSEVTMYRCDSCPFQSKHRHVLKKHSLVHRSRSEVEVYACDSCLYRTKYKVDLTRHSLTHKDVSEVNMYRCDSCAYETKLKSSLGKHLLVHKDPNEIKMFTCDSCPYQAKRKVDLTRHLLTHKDVSEVKMYRCNACPHRTRHRDGLRKHSLVHLDPAEVTWYECRSCSYRSKRRVNLRRHELAH